MNGVVERLLGGAMVECDEDIADDGRNCDFERDSTPMQSRAMYVKESTSPNLD